MKTLFTCQAAEEQHGKGPDVHGCRDENVILNGIAHFRWRVGNAADETSYVGAAFSRHAEIDQFHFAEVGVEDHHVLWFHVSMNLRKTRRNINAVLM